MKKLTTLLFLSLATYSVQAQSFVQAYQNRVNQLTQANITSLLQDFAAFGTKTSGSTANNNTLNWLKGKYQTYGYTAGQISEDSFTVNGNTTKNLVVTKTGTVYPNIYVIICGHYDTIVGPGVSDNGSGTSILLEAARVLKDIPTEYSVKFIHFSGEEQGLVGSNHYVNNVVFQNDARQLNIRLVFNIDQVGGQSGINNNTITCESDQTFSGTPNDPYGQNANNAPSLTFTQQLATCTQLYSPLQVNMSNAYASDYMPFEAKGDIITGFYETPVSGNQHTGNDTFANVNPTYVFNVGKAAIGALQHFAIATTNLSVNEASVKSLESVKVYPNPAKSILNIDLPSHIKDFHVEINDMSGKLILKSEKETQINVSSLENGVYLCSIKSGDEIVVRKVVIKK